MADNQITDSFNITQNIKFQMQQAQKSCDGKSGGIGAILRMAGISLANGALKTYCVLTDQNALQFKGGLFSAPKNHATEIARLEKKLKDALQRWMTRAAYAHMLAHKLQLTRFETVFIPNDKNGEGIHITKTQEKRDLIAEADGIGRSNFEHIDLTNDSVFITDLFLNSGITIDNNVFRPERTSEAERRLEWIRPQFLTFATGTTIDSEDIKKRFDNLFKQLDEIDTRINAICVQKGLISPEKAEADSFVQAEFGRKLEIIADEFNKAETFFKGDNAKIIIGERNMTANFLNCKKVLDFIGQQKEIAIQRLSKTYSR